MRVSITFLLFLFISSPLFSQQKGYYRSPAIYKNTVVFTAEGDLWKHDLQTGATARLTSNTGMESNPVFSPDGQKIIFTGQYEGASDLYEMSILGGTPKRLTWDYAGAKACGFAPDGKILYATGRYSQLPMPRLMLLNTKDFSKEPVPLAEAAMGCYAGAGNLFFTRFPNQGSATKRYKGGWIEQIWRFNGKEEAVCLTADYTGTSSYPMPYNGRLYFLSDRNGTMNIWSMDENGKDIKQQTFSNGWDLLSPSLNDGKIVYQKGADIWLYDIAANKETLLNITLLSDFDQRKTKWITSPVNSITGIEISPNGNYVAIISRGRVFVSPAKSDRWAELTPKSGIRFRSAKFINNTSIALLSDESGEFEIWKVNADGSSAPKQITKDHNTQINNFSISPDEKYIAYTDKNEVLRLAEFGSGAVKFTYDSTHAGIYDINWSPDSRFLTVTERTEDDHARVWVLDPQTLKKTMLTTPRLNSYAPVWSQDGNWLYFLSERHLQTKVRSPWGPRQPEPFYDETNLIYALPINSKQKFRFTPVDSWMNDSLFNPATSKPAEERKKENGNKKTEKKKEEKKEPPKVYDWAYAVNALYQLPVKNANIRGLDASKDYIYWLDGGPIDNQAGGTLYALKMEESKKYEPTEIAKGVTGFSLSANREKLIISFKNKNIAVAEANGQKVDADKAKLDLTNWSFAIDPQLEWKQMFHDAWRMMRDYFYDRNMHGVNWPQVRQQYEPLLARVTDRFELDNLLAQMVGELSALHTFVCGGDKRAPETTISAGFLGARFSKQEQGLLIKHIYRHDPDYPLTASPLNRPELKIKEGDVITAVNNIPVSTVNDIGELLANKTGIPVKLSLLNAKKEKYEEVVKPFSGRDDANIQYTEWELQRREMVDSLSGNDIGYVHLRAMGSGNMDEFVKQFYPVFNRKGLIIDVRDNFGGNIDSWVLEKLMRKAWMYWQGRSGAPYWNMQYAFRGPMMVICNQITASDGEAFAEGFKRLGLGKVVGMRTWGGEIWLSSDNILVDNGIASAAEYGVYGPEREWLIEGHGVEPDFVVDNLPFATYQGADAQLKYAIDHLQKEIKANPPVVPPAPKHPDKSFKYPQ